MRDLITNRDPAHRIDGTPLWRRAVELVLENMDYTEPSVSTSGAVTYRANRGRHIGERLSIKSRDNIALAAVTADVLLEIVSGQPCQLGEAVVKDFASRGVEFKLSYEEMRELGVKKHGFSDEQEADFKRRYQHMIGGGESKDNHTSRSRD